MESKASYTLIRSARKTLSAQIKEGRLIVRAPLSMPESEIERFLAKHQKWIERNLSKAERRREAAVGARKLTSAEFRALAERAKTVIAARVAYFAPIVGVTHGKITVRLQRSRWGSCNKKGDLSFNGLLMLAPPSVLDAIVVHELCHRKYMDHSPRFYAEVLRVCPDYRARHKWLKENGYLLFAAAGKD